MSESPLPDPKSYERELLGDVAALRLVREKARARLVAALDDVLAPADYVRPKGKRIWIQETALAKTYVEIQSSTYGFECFINLGQEGPLASKIPSYENGTFWRLRDAAPETMLVRNYEHGESIRYTALELDPELAPAIAALFRDKALPFLQHFHVPMGNPVKSEAPKGLLGRLFRRLSNPLSKDPNAF